MLDKFFLLNWKRVLAIIVAWLAAVILHNAVYALSFDYFNRTGGDEPVFFVGIVRTADYQTQFPISNSAFSPLWAILTILGILFLSRLSVSGRPCQRG